MAILVQQAQGAEYEAMLRVCMPSSAAWCSFNGWQYHPVIKTMNPAPFNYASTTFVFFTQYLEKLEDDEIVSLMDVDMMNVDPTADFTKLLKEHDIAVHGNDGFCSCGFIAVRNKPALRKYLKNVLVKGPAAPNNNDVSLRLHVEFQKSPFKVKRLDDRWNWYDRYFGGEKPVTHPREKAINIGFHGMTMNARIEQMMALKKELKRAS